MTDQKAKLEELKAKAIALGKDEGEDVARGLVDLIEELVGVLTTGKSWAMYILPFVPMAKGMLLELVDKIDGKEG